MLIPLVMFPESTYPPGLAVMAQYGMLLCCYGAGLAAMAHYGMLLCFYGATAITCYGAPAITCYGAPAVVVHNVMLSYCFAAMMHLLADLKTDKLSNSKA